MDVSARSYSNRATAFSKNDMNNGRQQGLSHGPGHLTGPSMKQASHYTQYPERQARQSNPITDGSLETSFGVESGLATSRISRPRAKEARSGSQAMGLYPTRHIRQSSTKLIDGVGESQDSEFLRHMFTQYSTGADMLDLTPGPASEFQATAEENFPLLSGKALGIPSLHTSGQDLPFTADFENDLKDDVYLDAFGGSLALSDLPVHTPNDLFNTASEHDEPMLDRNLDYSSIGTSDNFSGIFSPMVLENCSDTRVPPNTLTRVKPCSNKNRTCMVSATKVLESLHISLMTCLCSAGNETSMPRHRQPRMTDSVLAANRDAVLLVSKMLNCACSLRLQVQLVLTIICDKLIAWYRAMTRSDYDGYNDAHSTSPSVANGIRNYKDQVERVLHQPITIGDHCLDVALESKIRAQVVLDELQRLEALVETLSRRIKEADCGTSVLGSERKDFAVDSRTPMPPDEPRLMEVVHNRLAAFLFRQLQAVKAEVVTSLGDEHGPARAARAARASKVGVSDG